MEAPLISGAEAQVLATGAVGEGAAMEAPLISGAEQHVVVGRREQLLAAMEAPLISGAELDDDQAGAAQLVRPQWRPR